MNRTLHGVGKLSAASAATDAYAAAAPFQNGTIVGSIMVGTQ